MVLKLGLLGCGQIGQSILTRLADNPIHGISMSVICCRQPQMSMAKELSPDAEILERWEDYKGPAVDIVVEAAGHAAVEEFGETILGAGSDLYILSVGALVSSDLRLRLDQAAVKGESKVVIAAGALAGFDGLHSLRASGLESVTYRSTKPPHAWKGTLAETIINLDNVETASTFFRGNALDAARQFPKNANLAAAVALAGLGFEDTQVELIADRTVIGNTGEVVAVGTYATLKLELSGRALAGNPKSSAITGMSIVAALESRVSTIAFAS